MTTRVLMLSHLQDWERTVGGIGTVVKAYFKHLPKYDIELVDKHETNFDVLAVHAGMARLDKSGLPPVVSHIHGLYWTGDYLTTAWEYAANRDVIDSIRIAKEVTVPTKWVATPIQRDMRINPTVVPHGIDVDEWEHNEAEEPYILAYGKNRVADVCDPSFLTKLAHKMGDMTFVTTFKPSDAPKNVVEVGLQSPEDMKKLIQRAILVLSPIEETFGMLTLEAMASGKAIVGADIGGNLDLIQHGSNGFLYQNGNIDHMIEGINWAMQFRKKLGENSRAIARNYSWDAVCELVASIYRRAATPTLGVGEVSIVIPCYNYGEKLENAVQSCLKQTYQPKEIIIVNDGSTDNTNDVARKIAFEYDNVTYYSVENGGVARARNYGIERSKTEFVMCLDADDALEPEYVRACVSELMKNTRLDIAYTKLLAITPDGRESVSEWPYEFSPDEQLLPRGEGNLRGKVNQIPTAAVFRRSAWERVGGYDPRFCPLGAGSEDAEFFTRIIASGGGAKLATTAPLFRYSYMSGAVSGASDKPHMLVEPPWLLNKPWAYGGDHPFASPASSKKLTHPVHSYKNPIVSVIIPVGEGHEETVRNAINSVEGQTNIHWECIVVWDSPNDFPHFHTAYPHIKWIRLDKQTQWQDYKSYGAGYARNRGVDETSPSTAFIIFLDADDELHHTYIDEVLDIYREEEQQSIVYTDYARKFHSSRDDVYANNEQGDILSYHDELSEAVVRGYAQNYDCELAQSQINDSNNRNLYHWAIVTCLIPKKWHYEIGGFPEDMSTFEDVYYHWAMARLGKCYVRIEKPLVLYRMDTGGRRELGSPNNPETKNVGQLMLQMAREKLKGLNMAGCSKCPGNRQDSAVTNIINTTRNSTPETMKLEEGMVYIEYLHPNRGTHRLVGRATGKDYGYRAGGTKFVVLREDMEAQPGMFREIQRSAEIKIPREQRETPQAPLPVPEDLSHLQQFDNLTTEEIAEKIEAPIEMESMAGDEIDLQEIPGINASLAADLAKEGIETVGQLRANINKLTALVGSKRAHRTIEAIASYRPVDVNMEAANELFKQYDEQFREKD